MTGPAPAPEVAVVVPSHDRPGRLGRLLDTLEEQTLDRSRFEIVVAHDSSGPETEELLRSHPLAAAGVLRHLTFPPGPGPAEKRNAAWRATRAPLIAFTDDDCEATPTWLEAGLAECSRFPAAVVQGRTQPNPAELDRLGPFSRTLNVTRAGPWYPTCNIFYPRGLLERLEGFDERFSTLGGEDTDLAWRALADGAEARYVEGAVIHHAVENLGPAGHLRVALRWSDSFLMFRRHPELRRRVARYGLFWKTSHALLVQAAVGLALSRAWRPARLLAFAYLDHVLVHRPRWAGASRLAAPYFVLHDVVELYAAARGAIRHRVPIL